MRQVTPNFTKHGMERGLDSLSIILILRRSREYDRRSTSIIRDYISEIHVLGFSSFVRMGPSSYHVGAFAVASSILDTSVFDARGMILWSNQLR